MTLTHNRYISSHHMMSFIAYFLSSVRKFQEIHFCNLFIYFSYIPGQVEGIQDTGSPEPVGTLGPTNRRANSLSMNSHQIKMGDLFVLNT